MKNHVCRVRVLKFDHSVWAIIFHAAARSGGFSATAQLTKQWARSGKWRVFRFRGKLMRRFKKAMSALLASGIIALV